MASTVTLPMVGKVPTTYAYVAGAAAAGVLGYAWWTRGMGDAAADEELGLPEEVYDAYGFPIQPGSTPDYRPPTTVDSGGDFSNITGYENNSQWFDAAVDRLTVNFGVADVATASAALTRYLDRQTLSAAQLDMVRYVVNALGQPPEGRPYVIRPEGPPVGAVALPAPAGLLGAGQATRIAWSWQAVTGATGYDVELIAGIASVIDKATVTGTGWTAPKVLTPDRRYRLNVWARNSAGQRGEKATTTAVTTAGGPAGPKAGISVKADPMRTAIRWRWGRVPGARHYVVWPIIAGRKQTQKVVSGTTWSWTGLLPNHSYGAEVVAIGQAGQEISQRRVLVARTKR